MRTTSPRSAFVAGVQSELPILLGVLPFGMIYGVLARAAGIPAVEAIAMSFIVFAGSAQFIATQLIAGGTPGIIILVTTAIVNLRHMLYSASVAPYLKALPARWKYVLAYVLADETYAVAIAHYSGETELPPHHQWYFLGAGLTVCAGWQISSIIGVIIGAQIPASWSLEFTLPLTFIALTIPSLKDHPMIAAAVSAGVVAVLANGLPFKLGLMAAALTGIGVGLLLERTQATRVSAQ